MIEAWVDLGELKDSPSNEIPGFNERLDELAAHDDRAPLQHRRAGRLLPAAPHAARTGPHPRTHHAGTAIVGRHTKSDSARPAKPPKRAFTGSSSSIVEENVGRECLTVARELFLAAVHDRPFDVAGEIERLRDLAQKVCLGPSTRAIVEAAQARGIPVRRLNTDSLVQFGYGREAAADPGGRNRSHQRHCRGDCPGQGTDAHAAARGRRAGARRPAGDETPRTPGQPPARSACPWSSSRRTAIRAAAWPRILSTREQVVSGLRSRRKESDDVIWSKSSPRATIIACWWSASVVAAAAANRPTSSATACIPSRN